MSNTVTGDRRLNCQAHEKNTTDLAKLSSSSTTLKWVVIALIPIATVLVGSAFSSLDDTLKELRVEIKEMTKTVSLSGTEDALTRLEVEQIKKDILLIKKDIQTFHAMPVNGRRAHD